MLVDGQIRSIPSQLKMGELFANVWHAFSARKQGQSVADYYGKLVGQHNYQKVFSRLFAAVPSQPVDAFPADMLFKKRARRKDTPRSYTFAGGLQTFIDGMAQQTNLTLQTSTQVTAVARTEHGFVLTVANGGQLTARQLAIALPPNQAGRLLGQVSPKLASALGSVRTAAIESVGAVVPADALSWPRMMGLAPLDDDFFSVVTRDVVPHPKLRALTFHFRAGIPLEQRIERICRLARLERAQFKALATHASSLPALALGHAELTKEIDQELPSSGLYLTGNYFGGLAIEDCALRSQQEAQRFLSQPRT
jgi:protoporphyrinogen oxidase